MKFNLAHAASYGVAALSWIAALNPALVAAIAGPHFGAVALPVIATAGAVLAALHQTGVIGSTAASPPAGSNVAKLIPLLMTVGLAVIVTANLGACASTGGIKPSAQSYVTAAVDIAVATAEQHGVPAAKINALAKVALAADSGSAATLSTVANLVNQQLAQLNLPPADLAAAQILEIALEAAIQTQIGSNASVASAQAAVAEVLQDVIAATGG